jgi:hypothetical protein
MARIRIILIKIELLIGESACGEYGKIIDWAENEALNNFNINE